MWRNGWLKSFRLVKTQASKGFVGLVGNAVTPLFKMSIYVDFFLKGIGESLKTHETHI